MKPDHEQQKYLDNLRAVAGHMAREGNPSPPPQSESAGFSKGLRRWGPLGVLLAFVLGKSKWVVMLLKYAKLPTLLSMVAAVWVYATIWGLPFAAGFVLLIFVHEMGHALMMRQQNIPAGAPVFIPFVGAVIAMKGRPRDAYVEALVGIGGPVLGTVGAAFCLAVGWWFQQPFWFALAYTGFLLNLFNMLPIPPLDGGRITSVLSRWVWVLGLIVGGGVFWQTRSPLLFIVLLLGGVTFFRSWKQSDAAYYHVPVFRRAAVGLAYFGLLAVMAVGMTVADSFLEPVVRSP